MPRLQVLYLSGDRFVLVLDRVPGPMDESYSQQFGQAARDVGATGALVFSGEVEVQ